MKGNSDRKWPWYQQVTDAIVTALGIGIAIVMTYRNSYPSLGVMLVTACIGKISASQLLRMLVEKWDKEP